MKTIPLHLAVGILTLTAISPLYSEHKPGHEGSAWRASKLIGADLKTAGGEMVGEIKDVVLNLSDDRVIGVVIEAGGYLGIGDTVSVIPASALRRDKEGKGFVTEYEKAKISGSPRVTASEWADDSNIGEKLHQVRDAIGGDVTAADNTAQNEKDMDAKAPTPVDQGNGEGDLKITKDIRSAIVSSDLSFNAKNIKIITKYGKVTLRGVVDSDAEKASILKIAKEHASSSPVTDDLSVK